MFQEEAVGSVAAPGELMPAAEKQILYWLYCCMCVEVPKRDVGTADVIICQCSFAFGSAGCSQSI